MVQEEEDQSGILQIIQETVNHWTFLCLLLSHRVLEGKTSTTKSGLCITGHRYDLESSQLMLPPANLDIREKGLCVGMEETLFSHCQHLGMSAGKGCVWMKHHWCRPRLV